MFGAIKHLALKKKCIKYTLKALCKNFKGVQKNSLLFKKATHLFESMHLKNAFSPFLQPRSGLSYSAVGFFFSSDFCFFAMVF